MTDRLLERHHRVQRRRVLDELRVEAAIREAIKEIEQFSPLDEAGIVGEQADRIKESF